MAKSNTKSGPKPPKPAASKLVSKPKATVKSQPKILAEVDENAEDIDEDSDTRPPVPRGDKKEKTVDEKFQKVCAWHPFFRVYTVLISLLLAYTSGTYP